MGANVFATILLRPTKSLDVDRAEYQKSKDPALGKALSEYAKAAKEEAARVKELQAKWQAAQTGAQAGTVQSPAETAFLAKLPQSAAPTRYGRSLGAEAFAESYRLWKFDRAALERAAPGIAAWFESDAFTSALTPR